jgi:hypothetical protein
MTMPVEKRFCHRSPSRKRRQSGHEVMEFALSALLMIPIFLGMFNTGMNLIRSIEVQSVTRDLDDLYIHGADYSSYSYQQLAQTLATGMNLQFPVFAAGTNVASNTGTSGDGIVWVSQVEYVGATTDPTCTAALPTTCTNANSFVFTQRIVFGNSNLTSQKNSTLGTPTGATLSTSGVVANPATDANAKLPTAGQTYMTNLWQTTANGQSPLIDGQTSYVVESFYQTSNISIGGTVGQVYAIYFF